MQDELERLLLALLCVISQFAAQPELDLATHPGHLKPLGSQGPVHPIDELTAFPDSSTFYKRYTKASKPLLVKGGAKDSPAYALWTDEYLTGKEEAKSEIVTVEYGKKENRTKGSKLYSMKEFVEAYKKENIYLVAGVPKYIMQDVLLPYSLRCGGYQSQLVDTVMWFSSGGTKSVLHHDNVDNINCLFAGRKEMYFIEYPKYKAQVNLDHSEGGYSSVDPDSVDLIKYPGLKDVEFYFVQMEPGDCLYIPYKWYHHVRSYDRNIAVNVWWAPLLQFNASDCHQSINDEGLPTIDKYQFEVLNKNKSDEDDDDELSENMRIFVSLLFSIPIGMIMWKSIISVVTVNLGNQ
jgi:lysine-specific demethylase 8